MDFGVRNPGFLSDKFQVTFLGSGMGNKVLHPETGKYPISDARLKS
jgi:hypothetical protein